ncbi:bifunctional phosphopantothenoylcysteine decarboxylase/phosphopantothenate--cysteine ligase CoaBC [Hyphococcus luteus]|uniref:Coenzyme A biosynthesis bifunctional protein CoaBC n=1 Tax=Hyphococcus luteus TaxID=2058213 RepID=A0A2S7K6I3_9PROT|nr:bifunctional phosphopantothenoylcysteine decarboxylase/phosphopantothenate--cysteine ligase CoaBC [Marinicaulis flavus]PQA88081.1 bifunctional phosphopantothenoylcysteine decarboxylase/phosphopantothenate--cysteine ligase CoaBC [Marinicaulis flavus]
MNERRILLIIGGGIAAYKSLELIRELARRGVKTSAILTKAGAEFITPLSVSSLTGEKCFTDLFDLTDEAEMGHIELSRSAGLVVAAPATADLMAKAANGLANDLASTALLATDKPVMMAPAMNVKMWEHAATQRNLETLKGDGAMIVGPEKGDMACGEYGEGRMAEPADIADEIEAFFLKDAAGPLSHRRVLVTAGPTVEPIDPVRFIANRSSGKQGYAIAAALRNLGADVTLVTGPTNEKPPAGINVVRVQTAREMMSASEAALPFDCAVCCAAVADYRPEIETPHKIKKERGGLTDIPLTENPDILKTLSKMTEGRPRLVIGFAAETDDVLGHAEAKRNRKGCDWIVANDVSPGEHCAMGGERNTVILITEDGDEEWPEMSKGEVARKLADRIAGALKGPALVKAAE